MKGGGGRWIEIRDILSTATSTQSPKHKTNKKKRHRKQLSKQAIRQGKLREITGKMFANSVFITPGRYIFSSYFIIFIIPTIHYYYYYYYYYYYFVIIIIINN